MSQEKEAKPEKKTTKSKSSKEMPEIPPEFKCDFRTNKIDDFNKARIIFEQEKVMVMVGTKMLTGGAAFLGNQLFCTLSIDLSYLGCISEGHGKALFKFANDSILTLPYYGDIDCGENLSGFFPVDVASLEQLSHNDVLKIRVEFDKGYEDYDIPLYHHLGKKVYTDINLHQMLGNMLNCVLEESKLPPITQVEKYKF